MPWYYAGPEAKPVGPLSTDELHALRGAGTITPETFVIEHTGPGAAPLAWKRYRELFPVEPASAAFPAAPLSPIAPAAIPPTPLPAAFVPPAPSPLFPSGVPATAPTHPLFPSSGQSTTLPPHRPTNAWCIWGFVLSLAAFVFSCFCVGIIPAMVSIVLCIVGLVQINRDRGQSGHGLAIFGLVFSGVALLIALLIILLYYNGSLTTTHGLTVTEQTSNDSE
jgi:hypothetical protein